jgi:hypothetical protein
VKLSEEQAELDGLRLPVPLLLKLLLPEKSSLCVEDVDRDGLTEAVLLSAPEAVSGTEAELLAEVQALLLGILLALAQPEPLLLTEELWL